VLGKGKWAPRGGSGKRGSATNPPKKKKASRSVGEDQNPEKNLFFAGGGLMKLLPEIQQGVVWEGMGVGGGGQKRVGWGGGGGGGKRVSSYGPEDERKPGEKKGWAPGRPKRKQPPRVKV